MAIKHEILAGSVLIHDGMGIQKNRTVSVGAAVKQAFEIILRVFERGLHDRVIGFGAWDGQPAFNIVILHPQLGKAVDNFRRYARVAANNLTGDGGDRLAAALDDGIHIILYNEAAGN